MVYFYGRVHCRLLPPAHGSRPPAPLLHPGAAGGTVALARSGGDFYRGNADWPSLLLAYAGLYVADRDLDR